MTVSELIRTKRAVRQFTDEPLSDEAIRSILDAGRRAQSSKNTQPWHFIAIRDRATLRELAECGVYAGHLAGAPSLSPSLLPPPTASIWGRPRRICNWPPGTWVSAHASPRCGSRRRPRRSWVFPRTFTLLSRSPLALLSPAVSRLPLQNQPGASRSMRWFSGNVGVDERASLARWMSHACTSIEK